jgi:hypothetical protein
MSPSLKHSDLKTKSVRLTQNSIVISFRKCDNYYIDNSPRNEFPFKQLEDSPKSDSQWPANGEHPLPAPALSYHSQGYYSVDSASAVAPAVRCTCHQFDGWSLFNEFLTENSLSVWNPYLIQCLSQLQFLGFLQPSSLLIGGTDFCLEVIRSQWSRRVLRAPKGFRIDFIGKSSKLMLD